MGSCFFFSMSKKKKRRRRARSWTSEPVAGTWYPNPKPTHFDFPPSSSKKTDTHFPSDDTICWHLSPLPVWNSPRRRRWWWKRFFSFPPHFVWYRWWVLHWVITSISLRERRGKVWAIFLLYYLKKSCFNFFWRNILPSKFESQKQFWNHQHQRVPNITFFVMFLSRYPNDTKKSVTSSDLFSLFWHQKVQSDSHHTDSRIKQIPLYIQRLCGRK